MSLLPDEGYNSRHYLRDAILAFCRYWRHDLHSYFDGALTPAPLDRHGFWFWTWGTIKVLVTIAVALLLAYVIGLAAQ